MISGYRFVSVCCQSRISNSNFDGQIWIFESSESVVSWVSRFIHAKRSRDVFAIFAEKIRTKQPKYKEQGHE
jgi:hypothetical protein